MKKMYIAILTIVFLLINVSSVFGYCRPMGVGIFECPSQDEYYTDMAWRTTNGSVTVYAIIDIPNDVFLEQIDRIDIIDKNNEQSK